MFKSFDDFARLNESKEKFKVKGANVKTPNGESAFLIKYVGPEFNRQMMDMYMKQQPETKAMLDKMAQSPDQYFVAYSTKQDGTDRAFAGGKVWKTVMELINVSKTGKPAYQGFNVPPYNGFVPYDELANFLMPDANDVIETTKAAVASIQAQNPNPTKLEGPAGPNAMVTTAQGTTSQTAPVNQAQPAVDHPSAAEAGQQPIDWNGVEAASDAAQAQSTTASPELVAEVATIKGIKKGSRGPLVAKLQKFIEVVATAKNDKMALSINKGNISSKTLRYDGIWDYRTSQALGHILEVEQPIEEFGEDEVSELTRLMAKHGITKEMLTKESSFEYVQPGAAPQTKVTPKSIKANNVAKPAAKPAAAPAAKTTTQATPAQQQGLRAIENTNLGKIYFA